MARVPSKHSRDQQPVDRDLEGFLNNLQDWELGLKDKDKKHKSQTPGKEKLKFGIASEARKPMGKSTSVENSRVAGQYDYLKNYDNIGNFSSDESSVDANSEKELGNEYFKQKKFKEAVECYSRSIALSPTAVAYANRAMAYLKIKKFQEAEDDCTDALNLDDRYIKAYSRRSTARKELGKLKESLEDAEFALRLEPQNQEIKKQFTEAKSLLEKVILKRAAGALEKAEKSKLENNKHIHDISSVSNGSQRTRIAEVREDSNKDAEGRVPAEMPMEVETSNINAEGHDPDSSPAHTNQTSGVQNAKKNGKQELKASVQELAARAATLAMAQAAKNITPPNSAYQFEVSWRGLSGDPALQARLLKATSPTALPQIFKSALTAPLLMDIIRCIATFFTEEMGLAVKYLENLTRVQRFDMIIMCLSSTDKADLLKMWDEVFCRKVTPDCIEVLSRLRLKYCLKQ